MRILLASPHSEVWNSRKHIHMGLGYLAGALLSGGYQVDIWDASVEGDLETLDDRLAREHFDVVGVSAPTPLINPTKTPHPRRRKYDLKSYGSAICLLP